MNLLGVFGEGTVKRLNITIYGNWGLFFFTIWLKIGVFVTKRLSFVNL